jgi:hypothetical protein
VWPGLLQLHHVYKVLQNSAVRSHWIFPSEDAACEVSHSYSWVSCGDTYLGGCIQDETCAQATYSVIPSHAQVNKWSSVTFGSCI